MAAQRRPARARVRAADVARQAGVSIATVSLVANGKADGRVSAGTRQRVLAAIAGLGYVVDPAARSLVTGRRHAVALLTHDVTNPFISLVASGVAHALGRRTQLLLALAGADDEGPDLARVVAAGVDGALLNYPSGNDAADLDLPLVHLDDPDAVRGGAQVHFDLASGAEQLAGHLVGLGHRRLLYLDAVRPWTTFALRRRHLVEALSRQAPDTTVTAARSAIDIESARAVVLASWAGWRDDGVTAIVTAADVQAHGVLAALAQLDVAVPGRVSVASFDNVPFSAITAPPLTAVDLPAAELGREAATLLLELIGGAPPRTTVLPTSLVVRGSTGPAVC